MYTTAPELYLDLMKRCLTRAVFENGVASAKRPVFGGIRSALAGAVRKYAFPVYLRMLRSGPLKPAAIAFIRPLRWMFTRFEPFDPRAIEEGRGWPKEAETMIGRKRLDNLQWCVTDALARDVPGDLIETGVWRGGAVIFMRAILRAYGDDQRTVWAADSFRGLPKPNPERAPADEGDVHYGFSELAVPLETVQANLARYGLLDDQVHFLPGWFRDTLPAAPIERLAVMRLDGDMYESTMDALSALYPKLSTGGYVIIDDYALAGCRAAVDAYRREQGIQDPIITVDWTGIYWRKDI